MACSPTHKDDPRLGGHIAFQVSLFESLNPALFAALAALPPGKHRSSLARSLMTMGLTYQSLQLSSGLAPVPTPAPPPRPIGAAAIFDPPVDA